MDESTLTMLFYAACFSSLILIFIVILSLRKIRDYNIYFFKEKLVIKGRFLGLLSFIVFLMLIKAIIIFYYLGEIPCKIAEIHTAAPVISDVSNPQADGSDLKADLQTEVPNLQSDIQSDIQTDGICSKAIEKAKKLKKLIKELDNKIKTDNYEIIPSLKNEIIKEKKGKYYIIDLKDVDYKEKIQFPDAKYIIDDFDSKFQKAVYAFKLEIFDELDKEKKPELYIQGSANKVPFIGRQDSKYSYSKIKYFIKTHNVEQFSSIFGEDILNENISNENLPNLRAKFIQERLSKVFNTPIILQGSVTSGTSDLDRNVTLLMFIE
jgi:hypothetical protein